VVPALLALPVASTEFYKDLAAQEVPLVVLEPEEPEEPEI